MKKATVTFIGAIALIGLVGCSAEAGKNESEGASVKTAAAPVETARVDQPAPQFTLTDVDGTVHSLAEYKGKYVILEWINFDCPFVVKFYSSGTMQMLQKKYMDAGAVWLTICSSAPGKQGYFEGEALTSRMEAEEWMGTAYLADPTGQVGKMYGATNTPHMYVINPEGILLYAGAIDDTPSTKAADIPTSTNYVVAAMDAASAGQAIAVTSTPAYGCSVKY